MYLGRVVETGDRRELFEHPRHPYTAALLSAVPRPETNGGAARRHDRAHRRRPLARLASAGLRLPSALPALPGRATATSRRRCCARHGRADARGRLPLPGRALADDRGGAADTRRRWSLELETHAQPALGPSGRGRAAPAVEVRNVCEGRETRLRVPRPCGATPGGRRSPACGERSRTGPVYWSHIATAIARSGGTRTSQNGHC